MWHSSFVRIQNLESSIQSSGGGKPPVKPWICKHKDSALGIHTADLIADGVTRAFQLAPRPHTGLFGRAGLMRRSRPNVKPKREHTCFFKPLFK